MCCRVIHAYLCGHNVTEKAPCATSRSANCGVLNTKSVKHAEKCENCDHEPAPSVFDLLPSFSKQFSVSTEDEKTSQQQLPRPPITGSTLVADATDSIADANNLSKPDLGVVFPECKNTAAAFQEIWQPRRPCSQCNKWNWCCGRNGLMCGTCMRRNEECSSTSQRSDSKTETEIGVNRSDLNQSFTNHLMLRSSRTTRDNYPDWPLSRRSTTSSGKSPEPRINSSSDGITDAQEHRITASSTEEIWQQVATADSAGERTSAHSDSICSDEDSSNCEGSGITEGHESSILDIEKRRVIERVMHHFHSTIRATPTMSANEHKRIHRKPCRTHSQTDPSSTATTAPNSTDEQWIDVKSLSCIDDGWNALNDDHSTSSASPNEPSKKPLLHSANSMQIRTGPDPVLKPEHLRFNNQSIGFEEMSHQSLTRCRGTREQNPCSKHSTGTIGGTGATHSATDKSLKTFGKRLDRGNSGTGSDDEGEGSSSKRPKKNETYDDVERKRKFACPYFKRNSDKYISRRSCVGPGWEEVRRVKEHLYRNHVLPIFCPRCYETFKLESLLHDHQRGSVPCEVRPKEIIEGLDKLQEKKLKCRKKVHPELSEPEKWKDMYRILFPDDDENTIPSPYSDSDWERVYQRGRSPVADEFARYEQFLRRELPSAVRRELEKAVEQEFCPMEEKLKSQLVDIARNLQLQLFQTYARSRNAEAAASNIAAQVACVEPSADMPNELSSSNHAAHIKAATTTETVKAGASSKQSTVQDQTTIFEPLEHLEDGAAFEFDAVLFQFDELDELGDFDSAYGSIFADSLSMKEDFEVCSSFDFGTKDYNGEGSSGT